MRKLPYLTTTALLAAGLLAAPAFAAGNDAHMNSGAGATGTAPAATSDMSGSAGMKATTDMKTGATKTGSDSVADAKSLIERATGVVHKMKADPKMAALLQRAKGVYVVPDYAKGALIAGAKGGEGVMLAHRDGKWSSPAFYDMGAITIGAQAGVSAGPIAMVLMDQKAVDSFKQQNNWSLDAGADLTVVDYSKMAEAAGGKGDIVMWSGAGGAFAGGDVGVSDISFDQDATQAYYGKAVTPSQLISGTAGVQQAQRLRAALSG
ncbi:Las17-binding protein actin regulator [Tistlia consotensis]|uniref:Las17-binding protein actin regulator n=1 Tax=Tistlia consotensis USBA 355 TaxID=560819 RepID=A0A1Y6B7L0_9PROT|nr:lipid-binding SYLF domain-containing protein [Tistlia consotensis]SME88473.1 Las17-binding protein actin regulator [Tistlia consotensis USBA 355]SNR24935.1 Las17-binding protein actin regulator [Tistlia consotensis]